jgi:hypothetical protein
MIPETKIHPTMEAREVAALLGWKPGTFSRHKSRLIAEEAMPAPLPGGLYARSAVMRWLDTYADRKAEAAAKMHATVIASLTVHGDRSRLEEKYVARNAA